MVEYVMDFGLCWNHNYCVTIQFVSNFSTLSRVSVNAILINFFCSLPTWRKSLIVIYDFFSFSLLGAFNVVGVSFPPCLHHLTIFCEITTTLNFKCHVPLINKIASLLRMFHNMPEFLESDISVILHATYETKKRSPRMDMWGMACKPSFLTVRTKSFHSKPLLKRGWCDIMSCNIMYLLSHVQIHLHHISLSQGMSHWKWRRRRIFGCLYNV